MLLFQMCVWGAYRTAVTACCRGIRVFIASACKLLMVTATAACCALGVSSPRAGLCTVVQQRTTLPVLLCPGCV
jgi:hypothetical protein